MSSEPTTYILRIDTGNPNQVAFVYRKEASRDGQIISSPLIFESEREAFEFVKNSGIENVKLSPYGVFPSQLALYMEPLEKLD